MFLQVDEAPAEVEDVEVEVEEEAAAGVRNSPSTLWGLCNVGPPRDS